MKNSSLDIRIKGGAEGVSSRYVSRGGVKLAGALSDADYRAKLEKAGFADVSVTVTRAGYVKRQPVENFKTQPVVSAPPYTYPARMPSPEVAPGS